MRKCIGVSLILSAIGAIQALPVRAEPPAIDGTFGFDWLRPKKSRCAKLEGKLLATLKKGYTCGPAQGGSASGKPIQATCKANKGKSEYMLFTTAEACQEERETQLANGD